MKRIRFSPLLFRRIHKWMGLILGIQFVIWALSGSVMALLDMEKVGGHSSSAADAPALHTTGYAPLASLASTADVTGVTLRNLGSRPIYEVRSGAEVRLFDAETGAPVTIDAAAARRIATQANDARITRAQLLPEPNLESRDFSGPVWRIDFADEENNSAYVSADTGRFLIMRGDTWRTWDFFWMLHNMDYLNRTSFNHPLIVFVAFGTLWISGTGFYLLFKSFSRADFRWLRRRRRSAARS
ncbi:PepSY domain-containing protein [Pelagerythrobacter aerophilus]|uniref:PepSY domain-containing protein n=1 Tax=Pelagerythrobacter aerophilus TaxID=2306995 RepID=A0A418NKJ2_9SPHN|nr:PepSY domain-containing protein [Pelagerythrobacter aerophilus]RIV79682.1 hypothetical protein D2V04_06905 [Pelagerythrobacter aerophilus]